MYPHKILSFSSNLLYNGDIKIPNPQLILTVPRSRKVLWWIWIIFVMTTGALACRLGKKK